MKQINVLSKKVQLRLTQGIYFKFALLGMLLFCCLGLKAQQNNISNFDYSIPIVTKLPLNPVKGQLVLYTAPNPDEYRYFNGSNWEAIIITEPIKINGDLHDKITNQMILGIALMIEE